MRIIITGASGFIGQELLPFLKNHELLLIIRKKNKKLSYTIKDLKKVFIIETDLNNISDHKKIIKDFKPQICIHLFYQGIPDYSSKNSLKNYYISKKFFHIIKKTDCKMIICSGSCWEYLDIPGMKTNRSKISNNNPFINYKHKLHHYLKENFINSKIYWCRIFYCYGYSNNQKSLINLIIKAFNTNNKLEIYNDKTKCDFIYVKNVAYIISKMIYLNHSSRVYNLGSGKLISIKKIISEFNKKLQKNKKIQYKNLNKNVKFNNIYSDNKNIKKFISKFPYSFSSSIDEIIYNYLK